MNLSHVLEIFGGSVFMGFFVIFSGSLFLDSKFSITFKNCLIVLAFFTLITINYLLVNNAFKMMSSYIVITFVYKLLYKKNITQCAVVALIAYLMPVFGELIFVFGIALASKLNLITNTNIFVGNLKANIIICIFGIIVTLLIYKPVRRNILKIKEYNKAILIITLSILLFSVCSLFYKMFFNDWQFDKTVIFDGILILSMSYIGVIIIKQYIEKIKISDEYEKYVNYSKQSEKLVEQYSISQHEYKNELIIIKSMVHKNNKRLLEYLNEIIEEKDNIQDAWVRHLRYIPFGGLKGIIHNKISEMKDLGIKTFLDISKDVGKSNLKAMTIKENSQLVKIIGVFLDNAKEASLISDEKEVSICVYVEDNNVVFDISNSFNGTLDLSKIYNAGISSKGKNRGYGLALVKSIIDENNMFENETKIVNGYFVQKLKVIINK